MPTYDYVCAACGHAFEAFQEMSAKKLRTCPRCKKPRLERQVGTGAGLIFKGSGFYITDYRKGGSPPAEGSGSSASPAGASGPASAADSKDGAGSAGSTGSTGSSSGGSAASPPAAAPAAPAAAARPAKGSKGGGRKG